MANRCDLVFATRKPNRQRPGGAENQATPTRKVEMRTATEKWFYEAVLPSELKHHPPLLPPVHIGGALFNFSQMWF